MSIAPEPPTILANLCHVDNNVITVAWQQGHVIPAGNDVTSVLELDDGNAGQFRVSIARQSRVLACISASAQSNLA